MQESIKNTLNEYLNKGSQVNIKLENCGKLKKERLLPYLLVYRYASLEDKSIRLVLGESSYLISPQTEEQDEETTQIIKYVSKEISQKVGAVLVLELWIGEEGGTDFSIFAPKDIVPSTIETLALGLKTYTGKHRRLGVKVEYTRMRHAPNSPPLLTLDQCQEAGILLLGLEIPPFFLDRKKGEFYYLEFRNFKIAFSQILRKCIFSFIRGYTSLGIQHYHTLGSTTINPSVWKIDKQLSELETKYQFLLLISPINTMEAKKEFHDKKFESKPKFLYRFLPVDPDQIKEELFKIDIRSIEDPTINLLFSAKREEIDKQVTMLKERGTKNFLFSSIRLYSSVDKALYRTAVSILKSLPSEKNKDEEWVDCHYLAEKCREEVSYYQQYFTAMDAKVEIKPDVVGMLVSQGQLYIGESFKVPKNRVEALVHHEIGTHVLTFYNGKAQPFRQMSTGFAGYEELQEGLAVLSEYLVGGLSSDRMRMLAGRVVAAHSLIEGHEFQETFKLLTNTYQFDEKPAFEISARIYQGGGCTKDIIYLRGLISLIKHLQNDGELPPLYVGKIALNHVPLIKELQVRKILNPPPLQPRFLKQPKPLERLNRVKRGLPLLEMIN
ncbi:flavohemoglobin expression-modulating QEGLA motif protein [Pleomorphovibrio marinus]|uniref:flavohemoglobin expression-modulating QEGLA motif protein n=1 Tax=Pleomorphovibrio marinus TaxID=2164132 RepID=UPI000E0A640D|nr:tyrosine/phenylalanine carboxypeptidase domain-containing protein [Pleomorphovibrio marinus]